MIYATYDEQRSFPEYVDMVFKDLTLFDGDEDVKGKGYPIESSMELMDLMLEGYWPDFVGEYEIPESIADVADCNGIDLRLASFSRRRFKKLCRKIFRKYGEKDKAIKTCLELTAHYEALADEFDAENEAQELGGVDF